MMFTAVAAAILMQSGQVAKKEEPRFISRRTHQLKDLGVAKIKMGDHPFNLWVMDTDSKRMEGMMFVENTDFKDDQGMIFAFLEPDYQRFWMRNTLVGLDIAYIGKDKRVLNTYTMKPLDEITPYPSKGMAQYVIELRAGLMKKKGIKAGTYVEIPASVKAKD